MASVTPKQEQLIAALLTHPTYQDALKTVGISTSQFARWQAQTAFQTAWRAERRRAMQHAYNALQRVAVEAVATLVATMQDGDIPPSVRVAAASKLLDFAVKIVETDDIQARLDALEARAVNEVTNDE